jgi:predicted phosphate transport protein (TIGR00153 family)
MTIAKREPIMFSLFFRKEKKLESSIYSYLENLGMTQTHFVKAMNICLKEGVCDDFDFLMEQTHKFESRADDLRDEINELMYSRALIPEMREDIMALLEKVDEIPRSFEQILNMMRTQKITFPAFLDLDVRELIRISIESCDLMGKQITVMMQKKGGVRELLSTIDRNESHCDHIERRIIIKLFESDLEPFIKLQLKELVIVLGEISDQADRVSKRVNIMTMKRRV